MYLTVIKVSQNQSSDQGKIMRSRVLQNKVRFYEHATITITS